VLEIESVKAVMAELHRVQLDHALHRQSYSNSRV
jgi:hypothetical protein